MISTWLTEPGDIAQQLCYVIGGGVMVLWKDAQIFDGQICWQ